MHKSRKPKIKRTLDLSNLIWREIGCPIENGLAFVNLVTDLFVIVEEMFYSDSHWWRHVSFSRENRLPDYEDIKNIKKCFIGDNRKAIMIFPEAEKHVNIHPYCLHLYSPADEGYSPVPDFLITLPNGMEGL